LCDTRVGGILGLRGGGPGRLVSAPWREGFTIRGPHRAGLGVDPTPVPHHDPLSVAVLRMTVRVLDHFLSSSTISASTTSSAPSDCCCPAPGVGPASPAAPC